VIHGVLLAAGLGRRAGGPKALLEWRSQSFHHRALRSFQQAAIETVVVVVNREVDEALPPAEPGERRVVNVDPDQAAGMFASVRLGVAEALRLGSSGVLLLPVDHPLVTPADLRVLARRLEEGAAIVVATHQGHRGHPIGLSRAVMQEVVADADASTLRAIVRRDAARVVEAAVSEGALQGINTREDLARVLNAHFR
jgi:CTP:molybdopterin cytidylyltransferase MocA